ALRCASPSKAPTPTSSRLSPACLRRKARLTTSPAIAMPLRAFASGAARPSTLLTLRRSVPGSTGPGFRSRWPEPLPAGHAPAAAVVMKPVMRPDELRAVIAQYDGLALRSATTVTKEIIDAATNLKVIGRAGIGVDNVDIPYASSKGIVVMNTPFGNSITTAEHAIALMFALARQLPDANAQTQAGKWPKNDFMGVEVTGKTLGLIGAGNIGSIVADRALGLRMKVVAYDPFLSPERAVEMGVEKVELDDLLARADFITLHTPLT